MSIASEACEYEAKAVGVNDEMTAAILGTVGQNRYGALK